MSPPETASRSAHAHDLLSSILLPLPGQRSLSRREEPESHSCQMSDKERKASKAFIKCQKAMDIIREAKTGRIKRRANNNRSNKDEEEEEDAEPVPEWLQYRYLPFDHGENEEREEEDVKEDNGNDNGVTEETMLTFEEVTMDEFKAEQDEVEDAIGLRFPKVELEQLMKAFEKEGTLEYGAEFGTPMSVTPPTRKEIEAMAREWLSDIIKSLPTKEEFVEPKKTLSRRVKEKKVVKKRTRAASPPPPVIAPKQSRVESRKRNKLADSERIQREQKRFRMDINCQVVVKRLREDQIREHLSPKKRARYEKKEEEKEGKAKKVSPRGAFSQLVDRSVADKVAKKVTSRRQSADINVKKPKILSSRSPSPSRANRSRSGTTTAKNPSPMKKEVKSRAGMDSLKMKSVKVVISKLNLPKNSFPTKTTTTVNRPSAQTSTASSTSRSKSGNSTKAEEIKPTKAASNRRSMPPVSSSTRFKGSSSTTAQPTSSIQSKRSLSPTVQTRRSTSGGPTKPSSNKSRPPPYQRPESSMAQKAVQPPIKKAMGPASMKRTAQPSATRKTVPTCKVTEPLSRQAGPGLKANPRSPTIISLSPMKKPGPTSRTVHPSSSTAAQPGPLNTRNKNNTSLSEPPVVFKKPGPASSKVTKKPSPVKKSSNGKLMPLPVRKPGPASSKVADKVNPPSAKVTSHNAPASLPVKKPGPASSKTNSSTSKNTPNDAVRKPGSDSTKAINKAKTAPVPAKKSSNGMLVPLPVKKPGPANKGKKQSPVKKKPGPARRTNKDIVAVDNEVAGGYYEQSIVTDIVPDIMPDVLPDGDFYVEGDIDGPDTEFDYFTQPPERHVTVREFSPNFAEEDNNDEDVICID